MKVSFMGSDCITEASLNKYLALFRLLLKEYNKKQKTKPENKKSIKTLETLDRLESKKREEVREIKEIREEKQKTNKEINKTVNPLIIRVGEASECDLGIYRELGKSHNCIIETYVPDFKTKSIESYKEFINENNELVIEDELIENYDRGISLSKYGCAKGVWQKASEIDKLVYLRNVYQLRGTGLFDLSDLLFCWTPDGIENGKDCSLKTGSIQHSLRLAHKFNIPILNTFNYDRKSQFIEDIKAYLK